METSSRLSRRSWFAATSCLAAGGLIAGSASASEPIAHRAAPKFKLSLAAYSYRNLLKDPNSGVTLETFIDDCAKMQLDGTELTSYYFPADPTPEYLYGLKARAFQQGLSVSGTAIGNDFGHPPGEARDKQIAMTKAWIEYAAKLGAPVIRVFAGHQKKGSSPEETHRLMVEGLNEVCQYAGQHGVFLALENHGGPTATAEGLLKIIHDVNSEWFGVNLDSGNFHSDDIYGELAQVAPYALNAQIKVVVSGSDKKKVPTDFRRVFNILKEANYRGFVVLEYEEAGDPREECQKFIEQLREAMA
ncbi:sugar phosphate isomerase/epimerase family protein [Blastopirellula marina]|uniref:Sugar phosphate isomerase/epimerase n=1 Tax=Blastopirellula marina TaxID=124 RepID=A0A2S8G2A4_9BACT|nr:sugar phosphate isomerase/epimerase family protein [Blastopirellula marina]PQO38576.1 sugar phosphate isomerase/epimerase [Blastopirellula marina]PTL45233.1 sugar phosphate isomerase/epimerase [Blastopirellula marina]